jgi:hypothetical protein
MGRLNNAEFPAAMAWTGLVEISLASPCEQKTGVISANGVLQLMSLLRSSLVRIDGPEPEGYKPPGGRALTIVQAENGCGQIVGIHLERGTEL